MDLSAQQLIGMLSLQRHSTCGYVNETFRSAVQLPADALPPGYQGPRSLGDVLLFLVTPEAPVRLHRIRSDQMYHHYLGDPLEVLLLYAGGRSEVRGVGVDLAAGLQPQLFIPGGTFHTARVPKGGNYALLGTSVWLRAEAEDVEQGDVEKLLAAYPSAAEQITDFSS